MDLTVCGRTARLAATSLVAAAVLSGTLWGGDDDFPFGPFRMFSSSRELDEPVGDTQIRAVDGAGTPIEEVNELAGLRRAEIEGQLDRIKSDPSLLGLLAQAYSARLPDRPPLRQVSIVVVWHGMQDGQVTGVTWTQDVAMWQR